MESSAPTVSSAPAEPGEVKARTGGAALVECLVGARRPALDVRARRELPAGARRALGGGRRGHQHPARGGRRQHGRGGREADRARRRLPGHPRAGRVPREHRAAHGLPGRHPAGPAGRPGRPGAARPGRLPGDGLRAGLRLVGQGGADDRRRRPHPRAGRAGDAASRTADARDRWCWWYRKTSSTTAPTAPVRIAPRERRPAAHGSRPGRAARAAQPRAAAGAHRRRPGLVPVGRRRHHRLRRAQRDPDRGRLPLAGRGRQRVPELRRLPGPRRQPRSAQAASPTTPT